MLQIKRKNKGKILLTRSIENNRELAKVLINYGYEVFKEPLIYYSPSTSVITKLKSTIKNYQLIITSNYAASLIVDNFTNHNLKCYVVGELTADYLKKNNFEIILWTNNIEQLLKLIPVNTNLLYLRGNNITKNFDIGQKEEIIYNTYYNNELSAKLVSSIQNRQIQGVTAFSQKAAQAFLNAISYHGLKDYLLDLEFYCFSEKIATYLKHAGIKKILFPHKPNMVSFIELFK